MWPINIRFNPEEWTQTPGRVPCVEGHLGFIDQLGPQNENKYWIWVPQDSGRRDRCLEPFHLLRKPSTTTFGGWKRLGRGDINHTAPTCEEWGVWLPGFHNTQCDQSALFNSQCVLSQLRLNVWKINVCVSLWSIVVAAEPPPPPVIFPCDQRVGHPQHSRELIKMEALGSIQGKANPSSLCDYKRNCFLTVVSSRPHTVPPNTYWVQTLLNK